LGETSPGSHTADRGSSASATSRWTPGRQPALRADRPTRPSRPHRHPQGLRPGRVRAATARQSERPEATWRCASRVGAGTRPRCSVISCWTG